MQLRFLWANNFFKYSTWWIRISIIDNINNVEELGELRQITEWNITNIAQIGICVKITA